jgi:hypothetical protein
MSALILKLALVLLPPSRRTWGQAMKAEFACLPQGQTSFALGCLGASLKENVTTGEGWARIGFLAMLLVLVQNLQEQASTIAMMATSDPAIWPSSVSQISHISTPVMASLVALVTAALILRLCTKPVDFHDIADFGTKLIALHLITRVHSLISSEVTHKVFEVSKGVAADWAESFSYSPIVLVTLCVALYGWRGSRHLRNAALIGCLIILIGDLAFPVYTVTEWGPPSWTLRFGSEGLQYDEAGTLTRTFDDAPLDAILLAQGFVVAQSFEWLKHWFSNCPKIAS